MNIKAARECWMQTWSGRKFHPLNPDPLQVDIGDIAHALSTCNRFGGHLRKFYSVAAHSLHVCDLCPPELKLQGLLHDATEAYLGDLIRPLKFCFPEFKRYEEALWRAIAERFEIPGDQLDKVKHYDNVALVTERRDLGNRPPVDSWGFDLESIQPDPMPLVYASYPNEFIEAKFLGRFHSLTKNKFDN